jgi:hypothetical protein
MANYRAEARRAAQRYGLDPNVFERQIQQESGFNPTIRSPAGAVGIAQIMPATARGWGVNPLDPKASLDAAARNMASYVKKYGSYENALRAYNAGPGAIQASKGYAETNNYVRTILGGRSPSTSGVGSGGGGGGGGRTVTTPKHLAFDPGAVAQAAQISLPQRGQRQITAPTAPSFAAKAVTANPQTAQMPEAIPVTSSDQPVRFEAGAALEALGRLQGASGGTATVGGEKVKTGGAPGAAPKATGALKPGGGWAGTERPVNTLTSLAKTFGLDKTSGKRSTVMTASGNVSDHYAGNKTADAADLGGSVGQMDKAAVALARRLGISDYKPGQTLVRSVVKNGLRYQLLYRTNIGGNHFNHIHVGVKRV